MLVVCREAGGWWGGHDSARCSSMVLLGGQFLLLRSSSSNAQTSQRDARGSLLGCAGSGVSSPICGLEVDAALSLDQKRSCNTI